MGCFRYNDGMEIRICDDKEEWNGWFAAKKHAEFLQSWEWGEFQHSVGREPLRLQVVDNGKVVAQVQGFVHRLPLGLAYVYTPRIWNMEYGMWEITQEYFNKQKFVFFRIEPTAVLPNIQYSIFNIQNRQPQTTLLLDLSKSEDELLAKMHPKTRYNIKLAERKGVEIREGKNVEWFWKLNLETRERDEFRSHPKSYYEKMLALPICHQLTAFYHDEPVASNIYIAWGGVCTYLHGASTTKRREVMAPYLLQWRGIQFAKKFGNETFDWWGVSRNTYHVTRNTDQESRIKNHESGYRIQDSGYRKGETCFHGYCWNATDKWTGITRFKAGFGGTVKTYPGAVDIVFQSVAYKIYEMIRWLMRK